MKKNSLTYAQRIRIIDILRVKRDEFNSKGLTYHQAAAIMSKECGFEVTDGNLRGAAEAAGAEWTRKRQSHPKKPSATARIMATSILELASGLGVQL